MSEDDLIPYRGFSRMLGSSGKWRMSAPLVFPLALAALFAIFAIFGFTLYASRLDVRDAARTASMNIVTAVSHDIDRDIELLDLSLMEVVNGVRNADLMALPYDLRQLALFDKAASAQGMGALVLLDATGRVAAEAEAPSASRLDLSGQAFFQVHRAQRDVGLYVSRPFVSLVDGQASIALSRRVERDGTFAGVAVATIKISYFRDLFNRLDLGPDGVIFLAGDDGVMILREPFNAEAPGRVIPTDVVRDRLHATAPSEFEGISASDNIRRHFFHARVGLLPLSTFVGRSVEATYRAWWWRAEWLALAMALLGGVILILIAVLQIELRRRARAEADLAILATTDKLTGLANRRKFDETLDIEWSRARRTCQPLALLLLDVDHFKAFNDKFGHQGGDNVLAAIGLCLSKIPKRAADLSARYGGEEFAILLPGTTATEALHVGERIRTNVAALRQAHPTSPGAVLTVSIGVAVAWPANGGTAAALLRDADSGLYAAKQGGRDAIVLFEERASEAA